MTDKLLSGTFAEVVAQSQTSPRLAEYDEVVDLPSAFKKQKNPYMQEASGGEGPQLSYRSFTKVFVLWRSYLACKRCKDNIDSGAVQLPTTGEYTCPHTHTVEHKDVMDKILSGKALVDMREHFNLPDGTRCVQVGWFEVDQEVVRQLKKAEEHKAKNTVWPANVGDAFKDPVDAKKDTIAARKKP